MFTARRIALTATLLAACTEPNVEHLDTSVQVLERRLDAEAARARGAEEGIASTIAGEATARAAGDAETLTSAKRYADDVGTVAADLAKEYVDAKVKDMTASCVTVEAHLLYQPDGAKPPIADLGKSRGGYVARVTQYGVDVDFHTSFGLVYAAPWCKGDVGIFGAVLPVLRSHRGITPQGTLIRAKAAPTQQFMAMSKREAGGGCIDFGGVASMATAQPAEEEPQRQAQHYPVGTLTVEDIAVQ